MTRTFEVQVQDDHIERLSQVKRPLVAVAELIWNALDADADHVSVFLEEDGLGGIARIQVRDDGHGIPYEEAERVFMPLGGSWKRNNGWSREKRRVLHGKEGRGRFRAFALGRVVDWESVYSSPQGTRRFTMSARKDFPKRVEVGQDSAAKPDAHRGVTVTVSELHRNFKSLRPAEAAPELAQVFALYLRRYPVVEIQYGGVTLDATAAVECAESYVLPPIVLADGEEFEARLDIVEWRMPAERRLYFCDGSGFPLDETQPGIKAPGFNFTAYLLSPYFQKLFEQGAIELANMDKPTSLALDAAKEAMRAHFRKRSAERAAGLVEEWRKADVYPYRGAPADPAEEVERQVFDVAALNINSYLPSFQEADDATKRLQLRLLRQVVETAPADVARILTEVLDLPADRQKELSELLNRTTLSHIISASKLVQDRLDFLTGVEIMVMDPDFRDEIQERTQLHQIVSQNAWLFGEQYNLTVDEGGLAEVLREHAKLQGRELVIDAPVLRPDGRRGRVDLMFSRKVHTAGLPEREHLIVELKRPSVKLDATVANQIESYAIAVASNPQFRDTGVTWVFWAISRDMDEHVRRKCSQAGRARGILYQDDDLRVTVWAKTWGQIIAECKGRMEFYRDKLRLAPDRDRSIEHLKTTYSKYLGELFTAKQEALVAEAAVRIAIEDVAQEADVAGS